MKKYLFIVFITVTSINFAQPFEADRARGLFMSLAIGPRIPVSNFADSQSLGIGINLELSYTDNEYIPLFFYGKIGWEHFPGSIDFYRRSDYSSIATNIIPINAGVRLFLPAVLKDIVLVIPTIELGASFAIIEKAHQFKLDSGKDNYLEESTKIGFHVGAGFSMFLVEIMGTYTYLPGNETISGDLRIRIPIFIKL